MDQERREFLAASCRMGLALALPSWIAACAQEETEGPEFEYREELKQMVRLRPRIKQLTQDLADLRKRAEQQGRPLLVFVVPMGLELRDSCGQWVGSLVQHAQPEVLADLALADVAFIQSKVLATELKRQLSKTQLAALDQSWALLFEPDSPEIVSVPRTFQLEFWEACKLRTPYASLTLGTPAVQAGHRALARSLRAVLVKDNALLAARAERERSLIGPLDLQTLRNRADDLTAALRFPQQLRLACAEQPATRARWQTALAESAHQRLGSGHLEGAAWAQNSGCTAQVEDPMPLALEGRFHPVNCGMGHVPPIARRFLVYYADTFRDE